MVANHGLGRTCKESLEAFEDAAFEKADDAEYTRAEPSRTIDAILIAAV